MKRLAVVVMLAALAGCQTVNEFPMSQNTWRVEAEGRGRFGAAGVDNAVIERAATIAVREGYPRFVILDARAANDTRFGGFMPSTATTNPTFGGGYNTTFNQGTPIQVDVRNTAAIVRLLRPGDAGFDNALDAETTLARLSR